jgi:transcriptional regulator with XRE-family HTH domain
MNPGSVTPTSYTDRRLELGAFLRRRREALEPEALGITRGRRRIAKGLRREEVAEFADIGAVWYTWLEQGRPINISEETLRRVVNGLRLNGEEIAYVFNLAGKLVPAEQADQLVFGVSPEVQATLDAFAGPASVMNLRYDVIAWNAVAGHVFGYDACAGDWRKNNRAWTKFHDPASRIIFRDWRRSAENLVGMLRSMVTPYIGDPRFEELLSELRRSPELVELWNASRVGRDATTLVELRIDGYDFDVFSTRVSILASPGIVIFFNAPADAQSAGVLANFVSRHAAAQRDGRQNASR